VLPFDRLPGSDPRLGPEMKSTGEVMGTADTFGKAYQKAQMSVGKPIPLEGTAIVDMPVAGFGEFFDVKDLDDFEDTEAIKQALHDGEIDLVLSRERDILEVCVEETITYFSTIESAQAALEAIRHSDEPLDVEPVDDRPKLQEYWGQPKEREGIQSQIETIQAVADAGYLDAIGTDETAVEDLVSGLDAVLATVDGSALVLGDGDEELATAQDALSDHGYDAHLAADLPGEGDEDTATYMMLSKFSVLVDSDPSRRRTEPETARAHDSVLARLVPAGHERQSTHMLGGHDDQDVEFIETFEYENDPSEVLDEAISWAESMAEQRANEE